MIFNVLDSTIDSYQNQFLQNRIEITSKQRIKDSKYSIVFSFKQRMASIELVFDGSIDFIVISAIDEKLIFSKTFSQLKERELQFRINNFLEMVIHNRFV